MTEADDDATDSGPVVRGTLDVLSHRECWEYLSAGDIGRLVVSVGSQPDIFPVNYTLDDGDIVVRTAEGTKLAAALLGQKVAFEIDDIHSATHEGWSVVVHGLATESARLREVMHDEDVDLTPWASGFKNRNIRIKPRLVSGRRLRRRPVETVQP